MKIRIGYAPGPLADRATFVQVVDLLDRLRFDSIWVPEILGGPSPDPLSALGIAAGRVDRLKIGTQLVVPGRQPARLAKECATLDRLSGGRLLLTFVPGLEDDAEIERMGVAKAARGRLLDEGLGYCRKAWMVDEMRPAQEPLEVWLGGMGPKALERAGRVSDGWIPGFCTAETAGAGRRRIMEHADAAGREISPEHFGANIVYSRGRPPAEAIARLAARRPDADPASLIPTTWSQVRGVIDQFVAEGMSKFVLRPAGPVAHWDDELAEVAAEMLPLQS